MKTILHKSDERGGGDYGWLKTRYSFSFSDWYNPSRMGFGLLRVFNDDIIDAGKGFGFHSHQDMEIVTIVMSGSVRHRDNMGNDYVVGDGDVQVMSAGTGVSHAEENASGTEPLELFQLWIEPKLKSVTPRYEQKNFGLASVKNSLIPIVKSGVLEINQDATIYYGSIEAKESVEHVLEKKGGGVYVFVVEGDINIEGNILNKRDAIGISDVSDIKIKTNSGAKFLIIEVPMS